MEPEQQKKSLKKVGEILKKKEVAGRGKNPYIELHPQDVPLKGATGGGSSTGASLDKVIK